jgi:cell shape-determining protein MreD
MWIILILILFFAAIFEAIITIPLVLIVLLCLYIVFERTWIFALAFFMGLLLDIFQLRSLGQTSLFFLTFLIIVLLYERKFEIKTKPFVFLSTFVGTLFYLLLFGYDYVFVQALVSSVIGVLLFNGLLTFKKRKMVE